MYGKPSISFSCFVHALWEKIVSVDIASTSDVSIGAASKVLDASLILDEDSLTSNSDGHLATQQSIKAYADTKLSSVTTQGNGTGVSIIAGVADITLLSTDGNNALTIGGDGGLFFNPIDQSVVADIAARDALTDLTSGDIAYVIDASADGTVTSGAALYVYNGSSWGKISEFESLDFNVPTFGSNI